MSDRRPPHYPRLYLEALSVLSEEFVVLAEHELEPYSGLIKRDSEEPDNYPVFPAETARVRRILYRPDRDRDRGLLLALVRRRRVAI